MYDYTSDGFLKDFQSNKDTRNKIIAEKIPSYDFDKIIIYVTLRNTLSSNRGSHTSSLEKGSRQEEVNTKIIIYVSDCLSDGHKIFVKIGDIDIVTLLLLQYTLD